MEHAYNKDKIRSIMSKLFFSIRAFVLQYMSVTLCSQLFLKPLSEIFVGATCFTWCSD